MKPNTQMTVFEGGLRTNAAGGSLGRRVSFLAEAPAGDIRKALKANGMKGKELTAAVDKVLRGDNSIGWAAFEASVSMARSKGFSPTVADLNKAGNKLSMKLERPSVEIDKQTVKDVAVQQLSIAELEALVARKREKQAEAEATEVEEVTDI